MSTKTTKKQIIESLKTHEVGTIGFRGLITIESVDNARQESIDHVQKQLDDINANTPDGEPTATMEVIKEGNKAKIELNNGQFIFLANYPITGKIEVRSKDYIIGGCFCDFAAILPDTFQAFGDNTKSFETKAGSTIVLLSKTR
jgi:hypothetical protein